MPSRRDWRQYNKELVNRGKIHFWVRAKVFKHWRAKRGKKNGHPFVYGDHLIQAMCYIRFKFHFSLRETEGFFLSLMKTMKSDRRVPCYTQICRRMKKLKLPEELVDKNKVTDIVLDTTGLKVYGEGEWRAEKYGGRKAWRKLHLAMDLKSGKITIAEISEEYVHDTTNLEKALQKANGRKGKVLIDGIADSRKCYELAKKYKKDLLTPPKKGAVYRKESGYEKRNEAVGIIESLGGDKLAKSIWSKLTGYNRRVLIESMISRWKRVYGGDLKSRCEMRKEVEVKLKALMINEMIDAKAA